MPKLTEFSDAPEDWGKVLSLHAWNLLIHGAQSKEEDRCRAVLEKFRDIDTVGVNRIPKSHFSFQVHCQHRSHRCNGVTALREAVAKGFTHKQPNVLLDLTSLELDVILYLVPLLLEKAPVSLFGVYLVPAEYGQKRGDRLELLDIRQPRGFVSFLPGISGARDAAHFVVLGFDKGRADYFFERYDWDWSQVHALTGDPAYVAGGVDKATEANATWLRHLPVANRHAVAANDPFAAREFFRNQMEQHEMMDIVPIGPKPMLLGILLFYLLLPERDRGRVRLLYDFPRPRRGCTHGVDRGFLYNCGELLRRV